MRAPVRFAVLRHRLTHPDESPADVARHCNLHDGSVRAALRRLEAENVWRDEDLLRALHGTRERPPAKRLYFKLPNPAQFPRTLDVPHWISGEFAAASEGFDLVPERLLIYVLPEDVDAAAQIIMREFGKVAPPSGANMVLAIADPWMFLDPDSDLVERGQRLIDYADSRHIQILRGLGTG